MYGIQVGGCDPLRNVRSGSRVQGHEHNGGDVRHPRAGARTAASLLLAGSSRTRQPVSLTCFHIETSTSVTDALLVI